MTKALVKSVLKNVGLEGPSRRAWCAITGGGWVSETSKCRLRLAPYCAGYGVDLGFGGDPITPHAVRVDMPTP